MLSSHTLIEIFLFSLLCWGAEKTGPSLQPLPETVSSPANNPATDEKIFLGKQLFFDPRLSGDNSKSCASCHVPKHAWADGEKFSLGVRNQRLHRNTPPVLDAARYRTFFWDGRAQTLEDQALQPIAAAREMDQNLDALVEELKQIDGYRQQFESVFGEINKEAIAQALAAFERTLVSANSPLDRYLRGDRKALNYQAREGMRLFVGEAGCIRCHHGPMLSDEKFYRLGVGNDPGRELVTGLKEDRYKFRTPSLRNVALTAPYMHDGSIQTLYEVVEFYYRGVPHATADGLPLDIQPLAGNSLSDVPALVAFLEALTGEFAEVEPPILP